MSGAGEKITVVMSPEESRRLTQMSEMLGLPRASCLRSFLTGRPEVHPDLRTVYRYLERMENDVRQILYALNDGKLPEKEWDEVKCILTGCRDFLEMWGNSWLF